MPNSKPTIHSANIMSRRARNRSLLAILGAACIFTSPASQASVLDFDYTTKQVASAGNDPFGLGPLLPVGSVGPINQSYGDQAGVDVSYRYYDNTGKHTSSLRTWPGGYDELPFAAWNGNQSGGDKAEVELAAVGGSSVTLNSFRLGSWAGTPGKTETVKVYELGVAVPVYEFTGLIGVGNVSNLFSFNSLTSSSGYRIEWTSPWWTGIGAVDYGVSAVPLPGAVWLFGSALAGFLVRSRRSV
ncbi:hypothetical protein ACH518_07040 [Methylomonas sp. HW2-6]|uniref:hypothetical protein n=1 Tax=Methylomonas sp. HW2-6 TaxID=3376687 RepID=UPI004042E847